MSNSSGSFIENESLALDSSGLVITGIAGIVILVLVAIGSYWVYRQRSAKRLDGPQRHCRQSTEYMDCVFSPGLMAIVADASQWSTGKWHPPHHQVPHISTVPLMEIYDHLSTRDTPKYCGATTTTTSLSSSASSMDKYLSVHKCDSCDEVMCKTLMMMEQHRLPPLSVVDGELLHEGNFTLAFRATLKIEGQANRQVVVRRLLPELVDQKTYRQAFTVDISLSASLLHPRIVAFVGFYDPKQRVYDLDSPSSPSHMTHQAQLSAVTEFMPNGDLRAMLTLRPRNAQDFGWFHSVSMPKTKAQLALDIVDALVYLHCRQACSDVTLYHQRLKAQQVLLSEQCDAKLCAFGVRRALSVEAIFARSDFSVAWLAPELLRGEPGSEQADVYALGVLLTELDTCELPFASGVDMDDGVDEQRQLALLVSSGCIRPALSIDCPAQVQELVMRCLSFSPQQRPPAIEVQHTLRKLIDGTSVCNSSLASLPSNMSSLQSSPGPGITTFNALCTSNEDDTLFH